MKIRLWILLKWTKMNLLKWTKNESMFSAVIYISNFSLNSKTNFVKSVCNFAVSFENISMNVYIWSKAYQKQVQDTLSLQKIFDYHTYIRTCTRGNPDKRQQRDFINTYLLYHFKFRKFQKDLTGHLEPLSNTYTDPFIPDLLMWDLPNVNFGQVCCF